MKLYVMSVEYGKTHISQFDVVSETDNTYKVTNEAQLVGQGFYYKVLSKDDPRIFKDFDTALLATLPLLNRALTEVKKEARDIGIEILFIKSTIYKLNGVYKC